MADSSILKQFILAHEGGFSNKKSDRGKATNKGVTIATYRSVFGEEKTVCDLKRISDSEWNTIYKRYYWDRCNADEIKDQSVANMLVDFAWHSGVTKASKVIQKVVGAIQDGIIGKNTIARINNDDAREVFSALKLERVKYLKSIGTGTQAVNLPGWLNRVGDIQYGMFKCHGKTVKF